MHRSKDHARISRHGLVLAAPLFASALWLLAPASTALAADPPCHRGSSWHRSTIRIVIGGRIGDRRDDRCRNDRCTDRGCSDHYGRGSGRDDDPRDRHDSRYNEPRYYGLDSEAWCDLTDGRYIRAKRDFLDQIECRPCEPIPRIGHAIACGRLEHYREAEKSMRRAIDLDVNAFDALCVDSGLKREIQCLMEQYECELRHDRCNPDTWFMLASLQTILGCYEDALCSIENAQRYGDCSSSARALACFIEDKLECSRRDNRRDGGRGRDRGRR